MMYDLWMIVFLVVAYRNADKDRRQHSKHQRLHKPDKDLKHEKREWPPERHEKAGYHEQDLSGKYVPEEAK